MAEQSSAQERTEEPTAKRRDDARKKSQVPRSRELNTLLSLFCGGVGMLLVGEMLLTGLADMVRSSFIIDKALLETPAPLLAHFANTFKTGFLLLVPLLGLLIVAAFTGPLAMGGWSFSLSAVGFKLEKIDPLKGLARIFSSRALLELIKTIGKFSLVAVVATMVIGNSLDDLLVLGAQDIATALRTTAWWCGWSFVGFSAVLIVIAAIDVPYQLWDNTRKLRMTKQEVKDEMKETDGRPEVKSRIRQLQQEAARRRMMEDVPTANVVITNPTHFAVALRYDEQGARAPIVVAKGRGPVAQRIRELADRHQIPLVSAPPLARALYANTDLGEEIPSQLYLAVAQVLAYVYQLARLPYGESAPPVPQDLAVPEELLKSAGGDDAGAEPARSTP